MKRPAPGVDYTLTQVSGKARYLWQCQHCPAGGYGVSRPHEKAAAVMHVLAHHGNQISGGSGRA